MLDPIRTGAWLTAERARVYSALVAVLGFAALAVVWTTGQGMTDRFGRPIGTDFSGVWTAGRMLLAGDATGLFDPATHFAFQRQVHGNPGIDVYGWHYPPFFLVIAAVLALLPYLPALAVWQAATFAFYLAAIRAISPPLAGVTLAAIGFPAVVVTVGHGHNSFLTAGLLGFGLLLLERRPIVAGLLIGLLAYKPQFGLVLPVVMLAGGHWRAALAAAATVLGLTAATTAWLGMDVWHAFLKGAEFTRAVILEEGSTGWYKIQSTFSALRSFGAPLPLAYGGQFLVTGVVLLALALASFRGADRRIVAAMTAVGALLATPYCLDYDMALLGPAIAFVVAHGVDKGFADYEKSLLAFVWLLPLLARPVMMQTGLPVGVAGMAVFFAFLAVRAAGSKAHVVSQEWRPVRG